MAKKKIELRGTVTPEGHYDVSTWVDGKEATDPDLIKRGVGAQDVVDLYKHVKSKYGQELEVVPGDIYDCFPVDFFDKK